MKKNQLLECLVILTRIYNRPFTKEALTDGLPLKDGDSSAILFEENIEDSKSNFYRAAKRAGLSSKLVKYDFDLLSELIFPIILILEDDGACILLEKDDKRAKIILPKTTDEAFWIDLEHLKSWYKGYAFLVKPTLISQVGIAKRILFEKEHWFWDSIKYSFKIYRDVIVVTFLLNIFMLATPLFTRNVYDRVIPNLALDTLWVFVIGIIIIYLFDIIMKFMRTFFLEIAAKKSDIIISSKVYEYVLNIKLSHRFSSVGSFASNLKEYDSIRNFFTSTTVATLIDFPFVLIFLLTIYLIGGDIVFIPIISGIIILLYSLVIKNPLQNKIDNVSKINAYKNSVLIESLSAIETIKYLGLNSRFQWKWEEAVGEVAKEEIPSRLLSSSITTLANFLIQLSNIFILVMGVYAIGRQELTMGGLIAIVMLSSRALAPLNQFASLLSNYEYAKQSYKMLNNIMNLPVDREDGKKFIAKNKFLGKIEFKNVTFKYPGSEKYSLIDVSFVINPGDKVGIIGTNGSGKTTITKLILKLYEPESGTILIDDIDVKQIDPLSLRKNISYIPQDVVLFDGTVEENIMYGLENIDDEKVLKVLKQSGVENFISKEPLGLDTPVYENSRGLSGGQKQSIAIARALLKENSKIVLLDEPTNSLDSITEKIVENSLKDFTNDKTSIVVSHKNSILSMVEKLILLKDGKVLMYDSRDKVIKKLANNEKR